MANQAGQVYGVLAEFASPADLMHAAEKVRDSGYTKWDTHSPFPIHGMDKAMGLKDSKLGWIVLCTGTLGASGAHLLQWWSATYGYPMIISGKPLNSFPAFIPVTFEGGILLSAFGAIIGMLALNKLPRLYHALFTSKNFKRATDDAFFVSIESVDPKFGIDDTSSFLTSIGGKNVEVIKEAF